MKFKNYLLEAYKASSKEIKDAAKRLAKSNKTKTQDLKFIGAEDYSHLGMGKMFYFNITNPKHEKFKSTIADRVK